MEDRHVPSIGLRYWAMLTVASVFGANMGDIVGIYLATRPPSHMAVFAVLLAVIFIGERYDRSSTDAWYWMAAVVIQAASVKLADFSAIDLGFSRVEVIAGLALLLVTTFLVARSESTLFVSSILMSRPGVPAKPMADPAHWMAMIVASTLGAVAADLCTVGLGLRPLYSSAILVALLAVVFGLHRLAKASELVVFWLTTTAVRAASVAIADLLTKDPHLHVGLRLSALLTGALTIALLLLWREPRPRSSDI